MAGWVRAASFPDSDASRASADRRARRGLPAPAGQSAPREQGSDAFRDPGTDGVTLGCFRFIDDTRGGASLLRSPTASAVFQEEADIIAELAHRGWYHPGGSTGRACCFQGPEGPAPEPGPGRAPVTRPVLLFLPGTRPCPSHSPPLPPHPLAQTSPHAQTQPLSSSPDASLAHPWGRMGCQDPRQLPTPHPPHTHLKLHQCQVPRTWYRFDFQNHVSWLCGLGQVPLRL
ncbi:uncharacterized protein LOC123379429 [Felis catus]|uniref:uncharacterized protein LOC123379429 n=1 Tax=Felis catus TaxID=9685 RepID=UPI001D19ECB5|nr:uncharacterized protein LOC123379429 [Felis catus]